MIEEIKGDITGVSADVIVNAANTQLRHGGGVALAIARAAGEDFEKESREAEPVEFGDCTSTTAGNLDAQEVIHIPTIDYRSGGSKASLEDVKQSWRKALAYCMEKGYHSIATPLLGAGIVGLKEDEVAEALKDIAKDFPDILVRIVMYK